MSTLRIAKSSIISCTTVATVPTRYFWIPQDSRRPSDRHGMGTAAWHRRRSAVFESTVNDPTAGWRQNMTSANKNAAGDAPLWTFFSLTLVFQLARVLAKMTAGFLFFFGIYYMAAYLNGYSAQYNEVKRTHKAVVAAVQEHRAQQAKVREQAETAAFRSVRVSYPDETEEPVAKTSQ